LMVDGSICMVDGWGDLAFKILKPRN